MGKEEEREVKADRPWASYVGMETDKPWAVGVHEAGSVGGSIYMWLGLRQCSVEGVRHGWWAG